MVHRKTKTVFRIENPHHMHGMWYDRSGKFDPVINRLCPNALAKDFPMSFNFRHFKGNKKWYSSAKSSENMKQWFNRSDAENLLEHGFRMFKFIVSEYQELDYEVLFTREGVVDQQEISIDEIWDTKK